MEILYNVIFLRILFLLISIIYKVMEDKLDRMLS